MMNNIQKVDLQGCSNIKGLVVVIDVLRAFTTAAYAFAAGAKEIILVGDVEEAFQLHRERPDTLLMGEREGQKIPGFHFGNSPVEISRHLLLGKTLIQRTSAGTQGVVRSKMADRLLVSSFVVAEATYKYMKSLQIPNMGFVITGSNDGSEDMALADYLEAKMINPEIKIDPQPFLDRVIDSPDGLLYSSGLYPGFQKHDLEATCHIDKFPFAMEVFRENGMHLLRPIML